MFTVPSEFMSPIMFSVPMIVIMNVKLSMLVTYGVILSVKMTGIASFGLRGLSL